MTYYLIAAHPGCEEKHMHEVKTVYNPWIKKWIQNKHNLYSKHGYLFCCYVLYRNGSIYKRKNIWKNPKRKERQKEIVVAKNSLVEKVKVQIQGCRVK